MGLTEVVQRLEREAARERGVADADRDPLLPARVAGRQEVASRRQAGGDADPGPRMAAVEHVVIALGSAREAADAVHLAQAAEGVHPAGQELVGVGLVAGVPHDPIMGRVHDPVQRDGDLHRSERRREMAAGLLDGADHLLAELTGQLVELGIGQGPKLGGLGDAIEDGRRQGQNGAEYRRMPRQPRIGVRSAGVSGTAAQATPWRGRLPARRRPGLAGRAR